jgi:trk system potassium uptake protein TrkH
MLTVRKFFFSKKRLFFLYFILNISLGWLFLSFPAAWRGPGGVSAIDSLFISVSAVCVTGLATVDTSLFSNFGHIVLIYLMEAGGLGIITFSTLYLIFPGAKMSMESRKMIQSYTVRGAKVKPKTIVFFILIYTVLMQILGFISLNVFFRQAGDKEPFFNAVFHAVSAFCNAGFSRYGDSMIRYVDNIGVSLTLMILIILGGIGFMVIWDVFIKMTGQKKLLDLHTKLMIMMTAILIFSGAIFFFFVEYNGVMGNLSMKGKILASFFQSITPRTAGFNTVDQAGLGQAAQTVTMVLMFIGAGSGSTAGGIKVSTFFLLLLVVSRGLDASGDIRIFKRKISSQDISGASFFFLKAISILLVSILLLSVSEFLSGNTFDLVEMAFESISALGTVGLSLGITGSLSIWGKMIIIVTMFAGRVGLFALIMPEKRTEYQRFVEFPDAEVLIG